MIESFAAIFLFFGSITVAALTPTLGKRFVERKLRIQHINVDMNQPIIIKSVESLHENDNNNRPSGNAHRIYKASIVRGEERYS